MSTPVQKMKELVKFLPKKDIKYANTFIEVRDFESLKDLVWSDLYKIDKNLDSKNPNQEYLDLDSDKIMDLFTEVNNYCDLLYASDMIEDDFIEDTYDEE